MEISCFHGKRTSPASLVSGSHALPPAFGACTTARFLRFEPPNSTNLHQKLVWSWHHGIPASSTRCTALSPATPISPNAISHLQNTQRQKSMNLCQCPKMSEISKSSNFQKCFNWSAICQILSIHSHPKDSAPPPLWPRMPWARKYFRCMPLQRGKQENIRDICADSRYSYDYVTTGNEIPSSHWLGMKRQGSTLHIQSNGFFEI